MISTIPIFAPLEGFNSVALLCLLSNCFVASLLIECSIRIERCAVWCTVLWMTENERVYKTQSWERYAWRKEMIDVAVEWDIYIQTVTNQCFFAVVKAARIKHLVWGVVQCCRWSGYEFFMPQTVRLKRMCLFSAIHVNISALSIQATVHQYFMKETDGKYSMKTHNVRGNWWKLNF